MKKLTVLFFACTQLALARNIDVRLFSTAALTQTYVSTHGQGYYLLALTSQGNLLDTVADFADYSASQLLRVEVKSNALLAIHGTANYGSFKQLMLVPAADSCHFIIKGKGPERIYEGAIIFRPVNNKLLIINRVNLESYVAGVVESEGGRDGSFAYFKAQAVLARTWVLKNSEKHSKEGYNVRDDVSSQAYYSKAYLQNSAAILKAVLETKDTILVDENNNPIMGAFHANSGGQTANSEDAWQAKISYLRSMPDTFSLPMSKAYWTKTINKQQFVSFFATKMGQSTNNQAFVKAVCTFQQPKRLGYFSYNGKRLKLRYVRQKFGLRSTFFSVQDNGTTVTLNGRGFGHGVGLSQQGAMRMSNLGYSYKAILLHYFKGAKFGVAH